MGNRGSFVAGRCRSRPKQRKAATKMLVTLITILHVLVCVFLILVILLQAGKDAGMGIALGGGGGSGTVFGGRGAGSFLGKVTAACAGIFFVTSLVLSFSASYKPSVTSLIDIPPTTQKSPVPIAPPAGAASSKENEPSDLPPAGPADHPAPAEKSAVPAPAQKSTTPAPAEKSTVPAPASKSTTPAPVPTNK